jgi:integrase
MPKLTKRSVDAAKPGEKARFIWDSELKKFGLRVMPSGVKSFILQYRNEADRTRRMTLGRNGVLTPDQARKMAAEALVRVDKGGDPAANRQASKAAATVGELLNRYLTEHVKTHNAPTTQAEVTRLVEKRIRPKLGNVKVAAVTRQDVTKLHRALASTPRQANFVLSILSKAFNLAEIWGMRPEQSNPVRLVKRYKEAERDRFLSAAELKRLGRTFEEAETNGLPWIIKETSKTKHLPADVDQRRTPVNSMAIAVIRLLLFTGARLSEVLQLRWVHVDMAAGTIALPARKGDGRKAHPVNSSALAVLKDLPQNKKSPFVFPRESDPKRHISKEVTENAWQRIRAHAGIEDVRLHDLRHTVGTFASHAGANAFGISHLLRHTNVAITSRYVNEDTEPIRELSEDVGKRIEDGLAG